MLESKESHHSRGDQKKCENQDTSKFVILVESSSKEYVNKLGNCALTHRIWFATFRNEIVVEIAILHSGHSPLVTAELCEHEAFVNVMARSNPIGDFEESCHKLRSDNQAGKEIIEPDKDAGKDLSRWHAADAAHESLTEVLERRKKER